MYKCFQKECVNLNKKNNKKIWERERINPVC